MPFQPKNQVLTSNEPLGDPMAQIGEPASRNTEYPKAVYHRDSQPGHLISRLVVNADEDAALGDEWCSLAELQIETAPAAEQES